MMGGTEAQLLVVGNRPRYIRDHENRLDTDDASHPRSIRVVACLRLRMSRGVLEHWRSPRSSCLRPPATACYEERQGNYCRRCQEKAVIQSPAGAEERVDHHAREDDDEPDH